MSDAQDTQDGSCERAGHETNDPVEVQFGTLPCRCGRDASYRIGYGQDSGRAECACGRSWEVKR